MRLPFADRVAAGMALAQALACYRGRDDVCVLALPRGGVPVAAEIARALGAELDLMIVRKLGSPGQEELAMGALASGEIRVMNPNVIRVLDISAEQIEAEVAREAQEIKRREQLYRGDRRSVQVTGKCVILVDDGVATGATMRAALHAVRAQGPSKLIVAVPVAATDTVVALEREADEVVCLATPEPFYAIGQWYFDFHQISDHEVQEILSGHWRQREASCP